MIGRKMIGRKMTRRTMMCAGMIRAAIRCSETCRPAIPAQTIAGIGFAAMIKREPQWRGR